MPPTPREERITQTLISLVSNMLVFLMSISIAMCDARLVRTPA
jgi:hypothetical protein